MTDLPGFRWAVIGLWLWSSVSSFMVINTVGIILPAITADLGLSPGQQGLVGSSTYWANICLALPFSWITSRFSARWLTLATLLLATLSLFVQSMAPAFVVLMVGRLLFGMSNMAQQPARTFLTRQWFRPREVIIVNGMSNVFFGLVVGGGLALSPVILAQFGDDWRLTLRAFAFYFAALSALWLLIGRERKTADAAPTAEPGGWHVLRGALKYRDLWLCGFGYVGASMAFGSLLAFYPTLMLDNHGVALELTGGILALGVVTGGVTGLGVGYVATNTRTESWFLQALGALLVGSQIGMLLTGSVPLLFFLSFLNGIAWAFFPILITVPFNLRGIRPRELAVAFAFTMMSIAVGQALGPLLTGYIQEAGASLKLALLLVSVAAVSLVIAGATLDFGGSPNRQPEPEPEPAGQARRNPRPPARPQC